MGVQMSNFIGVLKGYCNISVVFNGFPLCSSLRIIYFLKTTRFGTLSMTRYIRTWHTLSPTTGLPPHTIRKFHVTACTLYWTIRLLITDKFSMVLVHESSENVSYWTHISIENFGLGIVVLFKTMFLPCFKFKDFFFP